MKQALKLAFLAGVWIVVGVLSVGCSHAQVPTTQHSVTLTWTAPVPQTGGTWQTACGSTAPAQPCTYIVSRYVFQAGDKACPSVSTSGTANYTPLNSSSPVSALQYPDTTVTGVTACYTVQTVQAGSTGAASNVAGPFAVPANPGAPTLGGSVTASLDRPQPPLPPSASPEVAQAMVAKLEGHIN
jgi:hypothetical protein